MLVIGHRGSPTEALENSLESFHRAIAGGASRLELDIQLSKDGDTYVIHDETLTRTTDGKGSILETSSAQLNQVRLLNGESLPTLDMVLQEFLSKVELNIELKGDNTSMAQRVLAVLPPLDNRAKRIIISSFSIPMIKAVKKHSPTQEVAVLWENPIDLDEIQAIMKDCDSLIFHPDARLVDQRLMEHCRTNGWEVYPYISLKEEEPREKLWEKLYTLGINGLCTNFPKELAVWLQQRGDDGDRKV